MMMLHRHGNDALLETDLPSRCDPISKVCSPFVQRSAPADFASHLNGRHALRRPRPLRGLARSTATRLLFMPENVAAKRRSRSGRHGIGCRSAYVKVTALSPTCLETQWHQEAAPSNVPGFSIAEHDGERRYCECNCMHASR